MTIHRPGISDAFLTAAGVHYVTEPEVGTKIPYYDRFGQPTGHYRIRLEQVRPNGQKYWQPPGSGYQVYFSHRPLNVSEELYGTEGECKTLAMVEEGYQSIGLGGLYGYTNENGNHQVLPALYEAVRFVQPKVFTFIGDSDTVLNIDYYRSAHFLASLFPEILVRLLQLSWRGPKGIDDLREASNGTFPTHFEELRQQALPIDPDKSLLIPALLRLQGLAAVINTVPLADQIEYRQRLCRMAAWARLTKGESQAVLVQFLDAAQEATGFNKEKFTTVVEDEIRRILRPSETEQPEGEERVDELLAYFQSIKPWPTVPPLSELLWEQLEKIDKYVVAPTSYKIIAASLVPVTYVFSASPFLPLLVFTSPEAECGKTAFLTVLLWSVYRPISSGFLSSAGMFRWIDELKGTVVLDEMRTLEEDPNARSFFNMGFNNSGHPVDTPTIRRSDPKKGVNLKFGVNYCKILGGIGSYLTTDTLSRSFVIPMQRAFPDELTKITDYALIEPEEFGDLQRKYMAWREVYLTQFRALARTTLREMPSDIHGRNRQRCCPSFTIGRIARDGWDSLIEKAARRVLQKALPGVDTRFPRRLLRDLYNFAERQLRLRMAGRPTVIIHNDRQNRDFILTDDLLKAMWALKESPWRAWGKTRKMLNAEDLYWLVRDYGIDGSERLKKDHRDLRGLYVDTIFKAFERYRQTRDVDQNSEDEDSGNAGGNERGDGGPPPAPADTGEGNLQPVAQKPEINPTPPTLSSEVIHDKDFIKASGYEKGVPKNSSPTPLLSVDSEGLTTQSVGASGTIPEKQKYSGHIPPAAPQAAFCNATHPEHLVYLDIETFYPWPSSAGEYPQPELSSPGLLARKERRQEAHPYARDPRRCALRFLTLFDPEGIGPEPVSTDYLACPQLPPGILHLLANSTLVGHNLDFDLSVLRRYGIPVSSSVFDTMLASRLLSLGKEKSRAQTELAYCDLDPLDSEEADSEEDPNPNDHTLEAVVKRYLAIILEKTHTKLGNSDWGRRDLSPFHHTYMLDDVRHLPALHQVLDQALRTDGLKKVWQVRMEFFHHLNAIKMLGNPIDQAMCQHDREKTTAELMLVREELTKMFSDYRHPIPKSRLKPIKIQIEE